MVLRFLVLIAAVALALPALIMPSVARAAHGISIDGRLKYPPGFARFDYTAPEARRGGTLVLHDLGGFDKMNPFTLKGNAPLGLDAFVFETLAVPSLDEPFAEYGLVAKDIVLADDQLSVTFTLDERARFSDGSPVTPEDVLFSLETLKSGEAHPSFQMYFQDISGAEVLEGGRIRFNFARRNRELHLVAAQLPVLSKAFYQRIGFAAASAEAALTPPLGSGPYVVADVQPGKTITFRRNPDYWAAGHPARRGMFNFDTIIVKYFKDQIVSLEALKAGEFDFMVVNIAKQWERDMDGPRFQRGELVKRLLPHRNNAGMQGFVCNTRRPLFKDRRVRQALGLAFDFEWTNASLFFNQYTRNASFFSNSELAATGLPSPGELAMLEPLRQQVPIEVFTQPLTPPATTPPGSLRNNLRQAQELLRQAGWQHRDGALRDSAGTPFVFEMLLTGSSFERVMAPYVKNLAKLGIQASYRTIDPSLYIDRLREFDFDMVVHVYGQSQSPGNEQRDNWTAAAAVRKGSRNLAGIADPAVDALVDRLVYATTQEELRDACRSLDRVLWHGHYVIPNWYLDRHRLVHRSDLRQPDTLPLYYQPLSALMSWWFDEGAGR